MVCQPNCRRKYTNTEFEHHSNWCFCFIEYETEYEIYWMNNFEMPVTHHSYSHSCIASTLNDLFRLIQWKFMFLLGQHFIRFSSKMLINVHNKINHYSCSSSVFTAIYHQIVRFFVHLFTEKRVHLRMKKNPHAYRRHLTMYCRCWQWHRFFRSLAEVQNYSALIQFTNAFRLSRANEPKSICKNSV